MDNTQYIIPKQLVRFEREDTGRVNKNVNKDDRELLKLKQDDISVQITLTTLSENQQAVLQDQWSIQTCPFQIAVELDFEYDQSNLIEFEKVRKEVRKYTVLSLILSNREVECYYHQGDWKVSEFDYQGEGGQGTILPYSFISLSGDDKLNLYYESSFENMVTEKGFYSRFTKQKSNRLKKILNRLLNDGTSIETNLVNLVNRTHTISAVNNGEFYMNVITLFSCFEGLLGQSKRIDLSDKNSVFDRFQSCRHAIAHLDDHSIEYEDREYTIKKHRNRQGKKLSPPDTVTFDIDDFEDTRVLFIDELLDEIGVSP